VRPPLWQSPVFLALQKISLTPAQLKTFNMLQFEQHYGKNNTNRTIIFATVEIG